MNKTTSTKLSIFVAFVLVFGIFSIKENVYAQTTTTASTTNNTAIPSSTNTATANNPMTSMTQAPMTSTKTPQEQQQQTVTTITRDSTTQLLEGKTLPKGEFIELI